MNAPIDATKDALRKTFKFGGTMTRADYWWFIVASWILTSAGHLLIGIVPLLALIVIPIYLWLSTASLSAFFRRMRDATGNIRLAVALYVSILVCPLLAGGAIFADFRANPQTLAPAEYAGGVVRQLGIMGNLGLLTLVIPLILALVTLIHTLRPSKVGKAT